MKWTLQRLNTTNGYLQACPIEFVPGLNCIIGARGTCKSTIVETIRFVFDCERQKIQTMITSPSTSAGSIGALARAGFLLEREIPDWSRPLWLMMFKADGARGSAVSTFQPPASK